MKKITKDSKILVTGFKGQLGFDVVNELTNRGYTNVLGIDIGELDITNKDAVDKFIREYRPAVVFHNAAWTAVDKAEQFSEKVYQVNSYGPKYIAEACKKCDAVMFYISTDYVFDGKGNKPFEVSDPKNGLSIYGKSKALGEDFVTQTLCKYFIIRTSWVFGINGNNYVKTMLKLAENHDELNIVDDQIGSPTYTADLAVLMIDMLASDKYGIYHATNEGYCSWAEFSEFIFKCAKKKVKINKVSTEDYKKLVPNQADRPLNCRISKSSLDKGNFKRLPSWQDATARFVKLITKDVQ